MLASFLWLSAFGHNMPCCCFESWLLKDCDSRRPDWMLWVSIGKFLLLAICFFFNFLTKCTLSNHHAVVPNTLRSGEVSQLGAETKTRLSDLVGVDIAPRKPQKAILTRFFIHQTFIETFMIFPAGNLFIRCFAHAACSSAVCVEWKISLLEKEILVSSATRVQHYFSKKPLFWSFSGSFRPEVVISYIFFTVFFAYRWLVLNLW